MARSAALRILSHYPPLRASHNRGETDTLSRQSQIEIDAEREQAVKDALDAVGYRLRFFRLSDEANEFYLDRLLEHIEQMRGAVPASRKAGQPSRDPHYG